MTRTSGEVVARIDRRLVWLGVPLALLLLRSSLAPGHTLLGFDLFLFDLPRLEVLQRAWRGGGWPGWSPTMGLGQPHVADLSIAAHYPGHALLLLAPPVTALAWMVALHIAAAYAGTYLLARRLRASPAAAALAATTYAGGGLMATYVHSPALLIGSTWLPWSAVACMWAVAPGAPARRVAIAAAPFALAFLGASPELMACAGALAWTFCVASGAGVLRVTARLGAVAALGAVLTASTSWPFLHVVGDTTRAGGLGYELASRWSLHPLELLGLLTPQPFSGGGLSAVALWHEQRPWHLSIYFGAAGVSLATLGLVRLRSDARARLLALVALGAGAYALGRWGPLYPILYDLVPPLRSLRYPAKAFVLVALCLALLAAVGLDHVRRRSDRSRRGLLALAALNALAAPAALFAADALPLAERAGIAAGAALATGIAVARGRWRVVVVVTLLELALLGRWVFDVVPAASYEAPPRLAIALPAAGRGDEAPARVATTRRASEFRRPLDPALPDGLVVQRAWRDALVPNTGMSVGARGVFGFSSFLPTRTEALRAALMDASLPRFYRLLGASHLVHARDEDLAAGEVAPLAFDGPWVLGRVLDAPPWAAVYARPLRADDLAAAVALVGDAAFDPRYACVVEGLGPATQDGPPTRAGSARAVSVSDDRLVLQVDAAADGVLVVREGWGRGWTATVDGRPAPVVPADVVFRAVPVPQGRHEVVFEYEAPGRRVGAVIALLGLTLLAGAVVGERARS